MCLCLCVCTVAVVMNHRFNNVCLPRTNTTVGCKKLNYDNACVGVLVKVNCASEFFVRFLTEKLDNEPVPLASQSYFYNSALLMAMRSTDTVDFKSCEWSAHYKSTRPRI